MMNDLNHGDDFWCVFEYIVAIYGVFSRAVVMSLRHNKAYDESDRQ
jgi:hypothetical protein